MATVDQITSPARAGQAPRAPVLASTAEAVEAVRALLPGIAARSAQTDAGEAVPAETIRELEQAGLFGLLTPRAYGGSSLGWEATVSVVRELGTACGSTAWVFGVLSGHNHMFTRFPEDFQEEVLSDPANHVAVVFRLRDVWSATPVEGGYRINGGRGRFCSGYDHARWVGINAIVDSGPNAGQLAFCLIEQERLPSLNDWDVMGLRGTQSRSIMVEDLFVSDKRLVLAVDLAGPVVGPAATEAAFYEWPYFALAPYAIVGSPLGVAQGMLDLALKGVKARLEGCDDEITAAQAAVFSRLSHAAQDIEMATDLILADARRIDQGRFAEAGPLDHARLRRNLAAAPQLARAAANRLFEGSGGSAIYRQLGMERMMRDVNAGAAHYAFTDDNAAPNYGRALLGLPPARSANFV